MRNISAKINTKTRRLPRARPLALFLLAFAFLFLSSFSMRGSAYAASTAITDNGSYFSWSTTAHSDSSGGTGYHFQTIGWDFTVKSGSTTKYAQFYTGDGSHSKSDDITVSAVVGNSTTTNIIKLDKEALEDATGIDIGEGSVTITANAIVEILNGDTVLGTYNLRTQLTAANNKLDSLGFGGNFVESGTSSDYVGYINQSVSITYYKVVVSAGTGVSTVSATPDGESKESDSSKVTVWVKKNSSVTVSYSISSGYTFSSYSYGKTSSYGSTRVTSGSWDFTVTSNRYIRVNTSTNTYTLTLKYGSATAYTYTMTYNSSSNNSVSTVSKTGYTFKGWNSSSDGSGTNVYSSGGSYNSSASGYWSGGKWIKTANTTLYAKFSANTYTVSFNANGGSGNMDDESFTYDSAKNLTANAYTKTGYTFTGWNTKADGSGTSYSNKQSVKNLTSTNGDKITLYAQWEATTYEVRLYANTPVTERSGTAAGQKADVAGWTLHVDDNETYYYMTMTYDEAANIVAPSSLFGLSGWWPDESWYSSALDGRKASATMLVTAYTPGEKVWNLSETGETVCLYALWNDITPPTGISVDIDNIIGTPPAAGYVPYNGIEWYEYEWTGDDLTLSFSVSDNDAISSFTLYKYADYTSTDSYSRVSWDYTEKVYNSDNSAYQWTCRYTVSASDSEGITAYKAVAYDRNGNSTTIYIRVKIDATAPDGDASMEWDGYTLSADINNIIEDLDGDTEQASGCDAAWIEVSAVDEDGNTDSTISTQKVYLALVGDDIKTGAEFSGSELLSDALLYEADYIKASVYIKDKVGNTRLLTEETYGSFTLSGYTTRAKGEAAAWRRGDAGTVYFTTEAFVDSVEISFPSEWVSRSQRLAAAYYTYDYDGMQEMTKEEAADFTVPIYTADGAYSITITAYKNGHSKSVTIPLETNGSVLDGIRTRLRVRN